MRYAINYAKRGLLVSLLSVALIASGCSFGTAIQKIEKWAPVGLQAFAGVVSILNPPLGSGLAVASALVPKLFGDLTATVNTYNAAPASDKAATYEQVLTALDAVQAQLKQILSDVGANTNSTAAQAAQAALLVLTTTLASIEAELTSSAPPNAKSVATAHAVHARVASAPSTVTLGGSSLTISGDPAQFKANYNHVMQLAGYSQHKLK